MKLYRTREEWSKERAILMTTADNDRALRDIATLFAEVERLRGALKRIAENEDQFSMTWAAEIARQALQGDIE